jgi:16S rRNA (guanine(966)-N(2))-methyltransferase RsmD
LRIISGESKGRRLAYFRGQKIRPTSDKIKGAIFNILGLEFEDKEVLDLFAGTGALGIEALSRGAKKVVFVENNPYALEILNENLTRCRYGNKARVIKTSVERGVKLLKRKGGQFDYIFIDPPYEKGMVEKILHVLSQGEILKEDGVITVEHSGQELPGENYGSLSLRDQRKYGRTYVSFFKYGVS